MLIMLEAMINVREKNTHGNLESNEQQRKYNEAENRGNLEIGT